MANAVLFANSFLSYLLLMSIIVVLCGIAIFIGIKMRQNKNAKEALAEQRRKGREALEAQKEKEAKEKKRQKEIERRKTQIERALINTGMQILKRGLMNTLFK